MSGLTGSPLRYCLHVPAQGLGSLSRQVSASGNIVKFGENMALHCLKRSYWDISTHGYSIKKAHLIKCSMGASYGDMADDPTAIFPRINIRDPYKRLGISREASEEEIQAARNFLVQKYAGHQPSLDAIESAHDKIIMQKFYERKNPKIDLKKKVREVTQSRVMQAITSRFRTPSKNFIIKTSIAFVVLGVLTVLFPTEEGPTLQVAISLIATMYLIYDRLKSKMRAFFYGAGAFIISWLLGTFLMVSVVPPILKGPRSLEVSTSLITYVLL